MTLYVLPDGSEIASLDINGSTDAAKAWVTHPSLGSILIDRDKLTEVPPQRVEPATDGSHVTVDPPDARKFAFTRMEQVRRATMPQYPGGDCWWWHDDGSWVSWRDILGMGDPKRWCPDPAVDAPALPWRDPVRDDQVRVKYGSIGEPYLAVRLATERHYHADDEGMDGLRQLVGALQRGYRELDALLQGEPDARRTQPTTSEG